MAKEKPRFKRFVGAKSEERVDKFDATHSTSKVPRKSGADMIRRQNRLRTAVQVIFTALTNGYAAGFAKGQIFRGASKQTCVPGLNCYSCPGAIGSCPIGSLQAVIGKQNHRFSFYVIGTLMIFGSLMGRFICGWLCPFGLIQDLLFKIPFPKKIRDFNGDKLLRYLKYLILIIFVIGRYIIRWVKNFAVRVMTRANYDSAAMSFVTQIINYLLLIGLILICLNQVGVPTTSFVAAFGAFGLGIGLALQNNMSNLASGLLILIFKPFRAGHVIQVGDVVGSVTAIQFMYTIIVTKDQKQIYIPNSLLTSQNVTNITNTKIRVIPFVFDIGYNNDHHEAIKILKNIFANDKRILDVKNLEIGISEFGDNSVRISAFARVKTNDYLSVQYSIMSDVKDAFDKYGIDIPYPQRVVYVQNVDTSTGELKGTKKKASATNVDI